MDAFEQYVRNGLELQGVPVDDTDMAIIEVAFESGHGSLSRFYDAFQRQLGCTPKDYRRRVRV